MRSCNSVCQTTCVHLFPSKSNIVAQSLLRYAVLGHVKNKYVYRFSPNQNANDVSHGADISLVLD